MRVWSLSKLIRSGACSCYCQNSSILVVVKTHPFWCLFWSLSKLISSGACSTSRTTKACHAAATQERLTTGARITGAVNIISVYDAHFPTGIEVQSETTDFALLPCRKMLACLYRHSRLDYSDSYACASEISGYGRVWSRSRNVRLHIVHMHTNQSTNQKNGSISKLWMTISVDSRVTDSSPWCANWYDGRCGEV